MAFSKQDTFNVAAAGLLAQGKRSENGGSCKFRGPDGLRCAVGFLIPDELYDPVMDSVSFSMGLDCAKKLGHDEELCYDLMRIHDKTHPGAWRNALKTLAVEYGLSSEVVDKAPPMKLDPVAEVEEEFFPALPKINYSFFDQKIDWGFAPAASYFIKPKPAQKMFALEPAL